MDSESNVRREPDDSPRRWSLLCVDDEPSVLRSIRRDLKSELYEIFLAESGPEGLEVLGRTPIDMVISDMRMPNMNGMEFLIQVSKTYPNTIRILLSGYADMDAILEAIDHGHIRRHIQKPWDRTELRRALQEELCRKESEEEKQDAEPGPLN